MQWLARPYHPVTQGYTLRKCGITAGESDRIVHVTAWSIWGRIFGSMRGRERSLLLMEQSGKNVLRAAGLTDCA